MKENLIISALATCDASLDRNALTEKLRTAVRGVLAEFQAVLQPDTVVVENDLLGNCLPASGVNTWGLNMSFDGSIPPD